MPPRRQIGATLLEAVIAMFIFSVGALGLAALQLTSLASSGDSSQRSMVIWKAQEFADRVRANQSQSGAYITTIDNDAWTTIGTDVPADTITCGVTTGFVRPTNICADTVSGSGSVQAGAQCTAAQTVSYDVWDVFCNPNGGLAIASNGLAQVADGAGGVTNLEIALFENPAAGNDDMVLVLEWLSREADANTDIEAATTVQTDLCGLQEDRAIASSLDVYCLRFSL